MLSAMIGGSALENLPGALVGHRSVGIVLGRLRMIGHGIGCPARSWSTDWFGRDRRFVAHGHRGFALCFSVLRLRRGGSCFQLLVDLAGAVAGGGESGGLGERFSEAGGGVLDLAASVADLGEDLGLIGFEMSEPVLQPGDQADRVGLWKVSRGESDFGAGAPSRAGVALTWPRTREMVTVNANPPSSPIRSVRCREPSWFAASCRRTWSRCKPASTRLR
jgi:hypothetical protein